MAGRTEVDQRKVGLCPVNDLREGSLCPNTYRRPRLSRGTRITRKTHRALQRRKHHVH